MNRSGNYSTDPEADALIADHLNIFDQLPMTTLPLHLRGWIGEAIGRAEASNTPRRRVSREVLDLREEIKRLAAILRAGAECAQCSCGVQDDALLHEGEVLCDRCFDRVVGPGIAEEVADERRMELAREGAAA